MGIFPHHIRYVTDTMSRSSTHNHRGCGLRGTLHRRAWIRRVKSRRQNHARELDPVDRARPPRAVRQKRGVAAVRPLCSRRFWSPRGAISVVPTPVSDAQPHGRHAPHAGVQPEATSQTMEEQLVLLSNRRESTVRRRPWRDGLQCRRSAPKRCSGCGGECGGKVGQRDEAPRLESAASHRLLRPGRAWHGGPSAAVASEQPTGSHSSHCHHISSSPLISKHGAT